MLAYCRVALLVWGPGELGVVSVVWGPGELGRMASREGPERRGRAVEATAISGSFLRAPELAKEKTATTGEPKERCQIRWPVHACVCVCVYVCAHVCVCVCNAAQ